MKGKEDEVRAVRDELQLLLKQIQLASVPQPKIHTHEVATNTVILTTAEVSVNTTPVKVKRQREVGSNTSPLHSSPRTLSVDQEQMTDNITSPLKRKRKTDASCNTSPMHFFLQTYSADKNSNTSPTHTKTFATSPIHHMPVTSEVDRMRNILLAELMSLQLLYSMFDLTMSSQMGIEKINNEDVHIECNDDTGSECKDENTPALSTPSGYETGSHSQLEIDKTTNEKRKDTDRSRNFTPDYFKFPNNQNSLRDSPMLVKLQESYTPKTGGLLEEIIEAQLSGCFAGSPSTVSLLPVEDRVSFLRREIGSHKKSIDDEIIKLADSILEENCLDEEGNIFYCVKKNCFKKSKSVPKAIIIFKTISDINRKDFENS